MHDFQANQLKQTSAAQSQPLSTSQEKAIFDLLSDGVFIVETALSGKTVTPEFIIHYTNQPLNELVNNNSVDLLKRPLNQIFPRFYYSELYETLAQVQKLRIRQEVEITYEAGNKEQKLRIALMPNFVTSSDNLQIIGCINIITPLDARANYLEHRAVKLIDHAKGLEISQRDLEEQVERLRRSLAKMERTARFDKISGLSNRKYFLEQGSAEFQRSRRYDHALSIVVISLQSGNNIIQAHGTASIDTALTGLAQICETTCRSGTDVAGRIADNEIAMLLPETNLSGALRFIDRLKTLIAETPIQLKNGFVRLGIRHGVDTMQDDDNAFMQSLHRAQYSLASER